MFKATYIGYVTFKDSKYVKIQLNEYFEEIDKSKNLTLVPTNESKEKKIKI